jgi:hypothetical protein
MRSARILLLLMLPTLSMACSSCYSRLVLHPVVTGDANSIDIQRVPAGQTFKAPAGKSGFWFSDDYVKEVMKARLEQK